MESPKLNDEITLKAKVTYIDADGVITVRFANNAQITTTLNQLFPEEPKQETQQQETQESK